MLKPAACIEGACQPDACSSGRPALTCSPNGKQWGTCWAPGKSLGGGLSMLAEGERPAAHQLDLTTWLFLGMNR